MTSWLYALQVILQEADFANNDHLQETIEAAQVTIEICVDHWIYSKSFEN
jgi:hypothetical protein